MRFALAALLALVAGPAFAQAFDTTRTDVPKSVQASTMRSTYRWFENTYMKDDFETSQHYRERMAQTPIDPKLRVVSFSPDAYWYNDEQHILSIPIHHKQLQSKKWVDVFVYQHTDDLGLPVDYGLSVSSDSEFGHAVAQSDTTGIRLPLDPTTAAAMKSKRVDCLLVFRMIPGENSAPLWEKNTLQAGWDAGPEMWTWKYLYAEVVGLWLFDPNKKRPVIHKFQFHPSAP